MLVGEFSLILASFLAVGNVCAYHHSQLYITERTIYKFSCPNSTYILEQTEFIMKLLNELVSANEGRFVDYKNSRCSTSGIFRGEVFDREQDTTSFSQMFGSFIAEEVQNSGNSVHLYIFSSNPFTLYSVVAEHNITIKIDGCILIQQSKISKRRILAYQAIERIKDICVKDAGSEDCINIDSETFCRTYNDQIRTRTSAYTPYNGRPLLLYPGSAADFRKLIKTKPQEKQPVEDSSGSDGVLASLGRFFKRVATLSAAYWLNVPPDNTDIPTTLNTSRFDQLISQLVMSGYELGRSIHVCNSTICELEAEVQRLYFFNHKRKVILMVDGYWNYFAFFLFSENWINKYVHSIVVISMPLDESAKNLEESLLSGIYAHPSQNDDILTKYTLLGAWMDIHAEGKALDSYTALGILLLRELGTVDEVEKVLMNQYKKGYYDYFKNLSLQTFSQMKLPNVDIHCIYGSGMATSVSGPTQVDGLTIENSTSIPLEDGDGFFTSRASNPCAKWKEERPGGTYEKAINNMHRRNILNSDDFLSYIKENVLGLE